MNSTTTIDAESYYNMIDYMPDADGMINNMDYGGLDLHSCIQELKDNSDDVKATDIRIYMLTKTPTETSLDQLIMSDNGPGMSAEKLANSIILAKKSVHNSDDIGKFGMGLNNATMAMGNKIIIVTKTDDGTTRGLYMDLSQMRRDNTYKPTMICEGAEYFRGFIARDSIYDKFMEQSSGVLISITDIKMNIDDVGIESNKLQNALNLGYKSNTGCTKIYTSDNSEPLIVTEVDVFYKSDPSKVEYEAETILRVYVKNDKKTVESVCEVLSGRRIRGQHQGKRTYYDGKSKPIYLKHKLEYKPTPTGKIIYKHKTEEVKTLPAGQYYEIKVRFICVKEDIYDVEGEDPRFAGVPHKRRGLWFYRGIRCVGKCIELGSSLNDECNRQRLEITYPADLDYPMGMRIQKQMGTITSTSISDALIIIWEQQNKEIIRQKKKERKEKKEKEKQQMSNSDADSDDYSDDDSDDDQPTPIIKAKTLPTISYVKTTLPIVVNNSKEDKYIEKDTVEQVDTKTSELSVDSDTDSSIDTKPESESESESEDKNESIVEPETVVSSVESDTNYDTSNEIGDKNESIIEPETVSSKPINTDTLDVSKSSMTTVGSHTRTISKSEKDVINKFISIMKNSKFQERLQEKSTNPSIVTHSKWTLIYTQLESLEYELNN